MRWQGTLQHVSGNKIRWIWRSQEWSMHIPSTIRADSTRPHPLMVYSISSLPLVFPLVPLWSEDIEQVHLEAPPSGCAPKSHWLWWQWSAAERSTHWRGMMKSSLQVWDPGCGLQPEWLVSIARDRIQRQIWKWPRRSQLLQPVPVHHFHLQWRRTNGSEGMDVKLWMSISKITQVGYVTYLSW